MTVAVAFARVLLGFISHIIIGGKTINISPIAKLLGVVFDQEMK